MSWDSSESLSHACSSKMLHLGAIAWVRCEMEDDDWVKKCTEYEVEGPRPRGPGQRLWKGTVKHVN